MTDLIARAKAAVENHYSNHAFLGCFEGPSLEDMAPDLARALIETTAERDALRERVARLRDALEGIAGSDDPYEPCGWAINTACAALQEDTPNE
jgi:hypothetical protein